MHQYVIELVSLLAIFAFVIVSPGADLAMILRQAIVHGRSQAIWSSIGVGTSLLFHITYTILGLGIIISQSVYAFNIIKWLGVAYLLYIGFKSLTAGTTDMTPQPIDGVNAVAQQSSLKAFSLGFAANALNPKPVFFFLSVFSTVVTFTTPSAVKFGYGLVMASCLILWFVGVSIFMTTPRVREAFTRASRWIDRTSGLVFIALGIKLATEKSA
jgi:RhtB (resistance to homoserine/threonine) family protein